MLHHPFAPPRRFNYLKETGRYMVGINNTRYYATADFLTWTAGAYPVYNTSAGVEELNGILCIGLPGAIHFTTDGVK